MAGPDEKPLLLLSRQGKGRAALLLSDQAWLWARGFEGGGPQTELLRRLAHWLMKEPELEEEALLGRQNGRNLIVERRTMAEKAGDGHRHQTLRRQRSRYRWLKPRPASGAAPDEFRKRHSPLERWQAHGDIGSRRSGHARARGTDRHRSQGGAARLRKPGEGRSGWAETLQAPAITAHRQAARRTGSGRRRVAGSQSERRLSRSFHQRACPCSARSSGWRCFSVLRA